MWSLEKSLVEEDGSLCYRNWTRVSLHETLCLACLVGKGVTKVEVLRDLTDAETKVCEMGAAAQNCTIWFLPRT